jgi:hypothetical protein
MQVSEKLTILPGLALPDEQPLPSPLVFTARRLGETEWLFYIYIVD